MIKKIIGLFLVALPVFALAGQAQALMVSDLQKKELALLVTQINNAAARKDTAPIIAMMPERLYQEMARRLHLSEQALQADFRRSLNEQFAHLAGSGYRLDGHAIHYAATPDGRFYALVPTRVETDKAVMEFMTPAIYDNTKWHLIYGGQKTMQNPVFAEIYPYSADIVLPAVKIIAK